MGKALENFWTRPCRELPKNYISQGSRQRRRPGAWGLRRGRGRGRQSWPVDRSCRSPGGRGVCLTPRAEMPRGRLWRFGGRLGMEGNTTGNRGAASPSVLACPLAGPCEAAVVASQGKAGIFPKTAKFGDFRFTGLGVAWGRRKGLQQRPGWRRWGEDAMVVLLGLAHPVVVSSWRSA